jgi:hypothetical protein
LLADFGFGNDRMNFFSVETRRFMSDR